MSEPLIDVTGARRRRARTRLLRRLKVAGVIAAVLTVIGAGVWVVYGSSWLRTEEVRVSGADLTGADAVLEAAGVPLGEPLASVDTNGVVARVSELVAVAQVRVSREWPATLAIVVTEERPAIAIALEPVYVWVSAEGRVFHTSEERPDGVLIARGEIGDEATLAALARVAADLPQPVREQASYLKAGTTDSVTVMLADGRRVLWGSAEDGALKASVIVPLLGVKADEYDVSAPTHPTTR
ncbi:MAG: FtsQ-type POTRA domain-containing protein [Nigerium sp.]|nr:FtsQ-type POTRA domain-containing protein [Nigerium sp.]